MFYQPADKIAILLAGQTATEISVNNLPPPLDDFSRRPNRSGFGSANDWLVDKIAGNEALR
jgi:hypothetical protein